MLVKVGNHIIETDDLVFARIVDGDRGEGDEVLLELRSGHRFRVHGLLGAAVRTRLIESALAGDIDDWTPDEWYETGQGFVEALP